MADKKIVPIESLFGDPPDRTADPRDQLADADVIVAVMGKEEALMYGREALQDVVDRGARSVQVMYVGLEQDDLGRLCELVRKVRGRCDYQP